MALDRHPRTDGLVTLAFVVTVATLLFAPLRSAPFVYEDDTLPSVTPQWQVPSRALSQWTVYGQSAAVDHLGNVAVHVVNGILVGALGADLVGLGVGVGAATVFLLWPFNSEAVAYASGRADLLLTTFVLIATVVALRWARRPSTAWPLGVIGVALVGAAMSKEIGLVAGPCVVLSLALVRGRTLQAWPPLSRVGPLVAAVGGLASGWVARDVWLWMRHLGGEASVYAPPEFVLIQAAGLWRLLALFVVPHGFTIDHDPVALTWSWQIAGVCLSTIGLVSLVLAWRRAPRLAWVLGWVSLAVAPRFLAQSAEWIHEYHLYLASVGLSVGAGILAMSFLTWSTAVGDVSGLQQKVC